MKITNDQLKQIVKEEIEGLLLERNFDGQTGFPLSQKGAKMIQNKPNDAMYKKYKKVIDKIAAGKLIPKKITKIQNAVRKKEGHPAASEKESKFVNVPGVGLVHRDSAAKYANQSKTDTSTFDDDLFRQKEEPLAKEPAAKQSAAKTLAAVTKQLISVVPQLPPEIEPKVEPNIAKIIEFLTKVSIYIERKK